MNMRTYIAGAAATGLLVFGPTAMAQQGSTSGPATGGNVEPSTATQKQTPTGEGSTQGAQGVSGGGAVSAGAPGSPAKSGVQGGPPRQDSSKPK